MDQSDSVNHPSPRSQEDLRRDIIEGCREMADVHLETEREYHPLEEEVERRWNSQESHQE